MRLFDRQTNNRSLFRSESCFGAWKCHHNNKLVCETLGCILKILCHKLLIFHILLKIQHLVDPDKCSRHICKHDGFLLSLGGLAPQHLCFQMD